jgi:general secretion pathway protein G
VRNAGRSGFTLIELLVVMTIVALLLTLALPRYFGSIDKSKGRYPETLESLASDKYLRRVPVDPLTESTTTWMIVQPEDQTKGGVYDVKSGAAGKSKDGSEYSQW